MKPLIKRIAVYAYIALVLYLFYRSVWAFALLIPAAFFYRRISIKEEEKKRHSVLTLQFKDALISVSAALRAGYSIENALKESLREMIQVYGEKAPIVSELNMTVNEIRLSVPAETAFENLWQRTQLDDVRTFSQVFKVARRSGGDMVGIVLKTSEDIAARAETKNEIEVLISAKRFENMIMLVMPAAIILYTDITGSGILDPLYGNIPGIVIMTVCLLLYILGYFLSVKILDIEV